MKKSQLLKRFAAVASFAGMLCPQAYPQTSVASYNKFRERVYAEYEDFRKNVLDHYAEFLAGEWKESETILTKRELEPKPKNGLQMTTSGQDSVTVAEGEMLLLPPVKENTDVLPGLKNISKKISRWGKRMRSLHTRGKSNYELAAERIADPGFAFGPYAQQKPVPGPDETWVENADTTGTQRPKNSEDGNTQKKLREQEKETATFDFYGITAHIPVCDFRIIENMTDLGSESGDNWKLLDSQSEAFEASRQLFGLAEGIGLNGYLTYRLAEHYVQAKFPDANLMSRLSTVHYLLSQMGYDARLAIMGMKLPVVMLPFDQSKVFSLCQTKPDGSGRVYTVMPPLGYTAKDVENVRLANPSISSAYIPVRNSGKTSDLRLTGLNVPMKPKHFKITGGDMTLEGDVNENLMAMLYRYPQMPMGDFASSWLDNDLRKDILLQVKMQLAGLSDKEAVNKLMKLFHYGFDYASDDVSHGFEKPYFLEENFYYDKNDCEDRAMFFSYLVWNALDLPCQLLHYSNHESTAVMSKDPLYGAYYTNDGKKYFSADPTYRGSHWGMIADPYDREYPVVDKVYE